MKKKLLVLFSLLMIGACTIGSSQLEAFFGSDNEEGVEDAFWLADFDGVKYQLIAINLPNGVLFSDRFGNSAIFDGWSFNTLIGFGQFNGDIEFEEVEVGETKLNIKSQQELSVDCTNWTEMVLEAGQLYSRFCGNQTEYPDVLKINDKGQIVSISQYIQLVNKTFTLTKSAFRD